MHILAIGLNQKAAPVAIREKAAVPAEEIGSVLASLRGKGSLLEAVLLSTCNRTEVYAVAETYHGARHLLLNVLSRGEESLKDYFYVHYGLEAVEHLFRVASGLDSMLLGETQILGQVKDAYLAADKAGTVGKVLHLLYRRTLAVGKRVHHETGISQNAVSVGYAAVELARKVFGDLQNCRVLLIGAGTMGELTAGYLHELGADFLVVNRTLSKAEELAGRFGGTAYGLKDLPWLLGTVDVVLSSTGAPGVVVERQMLEQAVRGRRRPIFLCDLAVPRDIASEVAKLPGVFLYDIDDLQTVVDANLKERAKEARKAERIIAEEKIAFGATIRELEAVPLILSLREKAEAIRLREVEKALGRLGHLSDPDRRVVERMSELIVNKLLNDPTLVIKEYAAQEGSQIYLETLSRLFRLEVKASEEELAPELR